MNLLVVGAAISVISISLMRTEDRLLNMLGMLLLIIGLYIINKGRKQLEAKDK